MCDNIANNGRQYSCNKHGCTVIRSVAARHPEIESSSIKLAGMDNCKVRDEHTRSKVNTVQMQDNLRSILLAFTVPFCIYYLLLQMKPFYCNIINMLSFCS